MVQKPSHIEARTRTIETRTACARSRRPSSRDTDSSATFAWRANVQHVNLFAPDAQVVIFYTVCVAAESTNVVMNAFACSKIFDRVCKVSDGAAYGAAAESRRADEPLAGCGSMLVKVRFVIWPGAMDMKFAVAPLDLVQLILSLSQILAHYEHAP